MFKSLALGLSARDRKRYAQVDSLSLNSGVCLIIREALFCLCYCSPLGKYETVRYEHVTDVHKAKYIISIQLSNVKLMIKQ